MTWGVQSMANAPPIFFYLKIFFGYCFEEGQMKKKERNIFSKIIWIL